MFAMFILLSVEPPDAVSMAWKGAKVIAGAAIARSAAEDRRTSAFLPREEWAKPRGRK
jgi:hypothetical protein